MAIQILLLSLLPCGGDQTTRSLADAFQHCCDIDELTAIFLRTRYNTLEIFFWMSLYVWDDFPVLLMSSRRELRLISRMTFSYDLCCFCILIHISLFHCLPSLPTTASYQHQNIGRNDLARVLCWGLFLNVGSFRVYDSEEMNRYLYGDFREGRYPRRELLPSLLAVVSSGMLM